MTVIDKLSDREGLIFAAITLIFMNLGEMDGKRLQWELFNRGIYISGNKLKAALAVMNEKGNIQKTDS